MIASRLRLAHGIDGGLVFLTHWHGRNTLWPLAGPGEDVSIGVIDFRRLRALPSFRASALVICDVERLSVEDEYRLAEVVRGWKAKPDAPRILNTPPKAMRRFALMKTLRARGVQNIDIYRLDDPATLDRISFPCFIREENGHILDDVAPALLHDRDALAAAVADLQNAGHPLFGKVAIEYEDLRRADGLYTKYSYFRAGDALIPAHKFFSDHWFVKTVSSDLLAARPELAAEERDFVETQPYKEEVREIFDMAGVEYGRIDFGVKPDGALVVFEINTNPNHRHEKVIPQVRLETYRKTRAALRAALAEVAGAAPPAELSWPRDAYWARWRQRIKKAVRV